MALFSFLFSTKVKVVPLLNYLLLSVQNFHFTKVPTCQQQKDFSIYQTKKKKKETIIQTHSWGSSTVKYEGHITLTSTFDLLVAEIDICIYTWAKNAHSGRVFYFLAVFTEAGKDLAIKEMADVSSWHCNRTL